MEYQTAIDAFFAAKNDETNQTSKRKYFVPQATEGENATDIGKELDYMTSKNPTKFISLVPPDAKVTHINTKLSFLLACGAPTFDPTNVLKIVFVHTKDQNFIRFAVLMHVLYTLGWPLVGSQKVRASFLRGLKTYRAKWNGAYVGYLLGYRMEDIVHWLRYNKSLGPSDKDVAALKANCEAFIREAVSSEFICELSETADTKTLTALDVLPHLAS